MTDEVRLIVLCFITVVDLEVFLSFNKISSLTNKVEDISAALEKSELLKLSDDKLKVSRVTPVQEKENEDECTIYVERLPDDTGHEWLKEIFSTFGAVDYVSLPKYKHNKRHKGFAFIEFRTPEDALKAVTHFESIGCKLPTQMPPNQLVSIVNFEPSHIAEREQQVEEVPEEENNETEHETPESKSNENNEKMKQSDKKKRKLSEEDDESDPKKAKLEGDIQESDDACEEHKRKRRRKKVKKHPKDFKQLGLRVLAK